MTIQAGSDSDDIIPVFITADAVVVLLDEEMLVFSECAAIKSYILVLLYLR